MMNFKQIYVESYEFYTKRWIDMEEISGMMGVNLWSKH